MYACLIKYGIYAYRNKIQNINIMHIGCRQGCVLIIKLCLQLVIMSISYEHSKQNWPHLTIFYQHTIPSGHKLPCHTL